MAFLRKYVWVLVVIGMIVLSLVIGLIFLIISKCISTKGKHKVFRHQKRSDTYFFESNKYQERNLDACSPVPSLPPRTQFVTEDALGFEEQADEHDYEQSTEQHPDYVKAEEETKLMSSSSSFYNYSNTQKRPSALLGENHKDLESWENSFEECTDQQLDYVKMEGETNVLPPPPFYNSPNGKSGASLGESYENLAEENDYEEGVDHQPDYETADNETENFPPPPLCKDPRISGGSLCQSYEYMAEENNYEESADQQPDYETADNETENFPPPPLCNDPRISGASLCQSHEYLAEENDYEESADHQPDYETADNENENFPPPPLCNDPRISGASLCQSHEYLAEENDYEESAYQPDYITVEDEEADEEADPAADDTSEDYDDIGSENEEDYDDVA